MMAILSFGWMRRGGRRVEKEEEGGEGKLAIQSFGPSLKLVVGDGIFLRG